MLWSVCSKINRKQQLVQKMNVWQPSAKYSGASLSNDLTRGMCCCYSQLYTVRTLLDSNIHNHMLQRDTLHHCLHVYWVAAHRQPCCCEGGVALKESLPISKARDCDCSEPGIWITVVSGASGRLPAVTEFNLEAGKLDAEADTKESGRLPVRGSWKESGRLEVWFVKELCRSAADA